jgi:inosine-uridine nucleoside N-ribohydrolase
MKEYPYNYSFEVPAKKKVRLIIDTDCKNEADDQFALVHALMTPKFNIAGVIGAHYGTAKCLDSMQQSYDEINRVLEYMDLKGKVPVFKGAERAIPDERTPAPSEGSELIIREALKDDPLPLYVLLWGPVTDVGSALLQRPEIAEKLHVVWLGGGPYPQGGREYNLSNDIHAANVMMKSRADVSMIVENSFRHVNMSLAELELKVSRRGKIGWYLFKQLTDFNMAYGESPEWPYGESWNLGDTPTIAVMLNPMDFAWEWITAPLFTQDMYYVRCPQNRSIRIYKDLDARYVLEDFFAKLQLNYPEDYVPE